MIENQSLIQFTPRSVLMALESQSAKKEKKEKKEKKKNSKKGLFEVLGGSKEIILNGEDLSARGNGREVLLRSIAGFLESNGFKKTLAIFQSEAQLEENSWKSPVVDLNDFAAKLSDSSDVLAVAAIESNKTQDTETEKKIRKKSSKDANAQIVDERTTLEKSQLIDDEQQQERREKRKKKSSEELKSAEEERKEVNQEKKDKKKKKESNPSENGNVQAEENDKKKEKEEKKKKRKEVEEVKETHETKEENELEPNEEKKEKKKRKESENEEMESGENGGKKKDREGKKTKKKESDVGKETQETNVEDEEKPVSKKRKKGEENNVENDGKKRKLDEAIGDLETAPEENEFKSGKKENQSAEPKSANAFKRVKIEEVKYVDDRLQDNSYWAKDGADSGYGAKAQQILEQVRGRDFRHEKTKKKRGSYKGGQIDLQSHSIKFNYSDEE